MSTAPRDSAIHPGARQIVRRCLGLEPGQDLVIFLDETTIDVAVALAEAADSLGVQFIAGAGAGVVSAPHPSPGRTSACRCRVWRSRRAAS